LKKLSIITLVIICLGISTIASAKCIKSIALKNLSLNTVDFTTVVDPGYIPEVKKGQDYILPGDFMTGCLGNTCIITINPVNSSSEITTISNVPKGSQIYYAHPGKDGYAIVENANVCAPY